MEWHPESYFLLRTPALPFTNLPFAQVFQALVEDQYFIDSIYLASPVLYKKTLELRSNALPEDECRGVRHSLHKYYLRSSYRCTPFGLFAGITTAQFGDTSNLQLPRRDAQIRYGRIDSGVLSESISEIEVAKDVQDIVVWYPNNTLYRIEGQLRYLEYNSNTNQTRSHQISKVDWSEYLDLILMTSRGGAKYQDLVLLLLNEGIGRGDAEVFIDDIIRSKVLISELEMSVVGKEYFDKVADVLQRCPSRKDNIQIVRQYIGQIANQANSLVEISEGIRRGLSFKRRIKEDETVLQIDLIKPSSNIVLNRKVTDELKIALRLLSAIRIPIETEMDKFKQKFFDLYGERVIRLMEVLDPECGLGYPTYAKDALTPEPLLHDLDFSHISDNGVVTVNEKLQKFILRKFTEAIKGRHFEISLNLNEVLDLFSVSHPLPNTLFTQFQILSKSERDLDNGNFLLIHMLSSGPNCASVLGRFCHSDPKLYEFVKATIKKGQERTSAIEAEVLHVPYGRVASILMRPTLSDYEIPLISPSSVAASHTVRLEDLVLFVYNQRLVLYHLGLEKEIIPKLTTAHNYSNNSIAHYRFLCDLENQGSDHTFGWDWGLLEEQPFLPRVKVGKVILSPAKWILKLNGQSSVQDVRDYLKVFTSTHGVPDNVVLSIGDNQLPIRLNDEECQSILIQELKRHQRIELTECYFLPDNLVVSGDDGKYTNELILPWVSDKISPKVPRPSFEKSTKRTFWPSSEWVYMKVYCGFYSADKLLLEIVRPLVNSLENKGVLDCFYFIRYADPEFHVRLRFKLRKPVNQSTINKLYKTIEKRGVSFLISRIQLDTYEREIERYGAMNIENSESIFFVDSIAVLEILSCIEIHNDVNLRWLVAMKGVDDLLDSFGYEMNEKTKLMEELSTSFRDEFDFTGETGKNQLAKKVRVSRKIIDEFVRECSATNKYEQLIQHLTTRKAKLTILGARITHLIKSGQTLVSKNSLTKSYIHMYLNRLFRSKQRLQEMVVYDMLHMDFKSKEGKSVR
jgi:lantibiotic biosynthesis protein